MGEDIPLRAYRDWKRWCALPRFFFDDPEAVGITRRFAEVRMPVAAAVALDDVWAPPASRDAFFSGFTAAEVDSIDLDPADLGTGPVGHMGYFRPGVGASLWPRILDWLVAHGLPEHETPGRRTAARPPLLERSPRASGDVIRACE
jgi:predicted alpha/beta hydrolase